jgi:uncharacterized protein (DUF2235 family)
MAPATKLPSALKSFQTFLSYFGACAGQPRARPVRLYFITRGVGTVLRPSQWRRFLQAATAFFGLATGYRLDDDVLTAYVFLMEHYEDGDDIFLFGFSRGAYTVRLLAALIHKVGLLHGSP